MLTASFFTYRGPGRISIALYAPRGTPASFRIYKALAPTRDMLKLAFDPYFDLYHERILAPLDPAGVWRDLHALAGEHEPVLLCWERPPFSAGNWCHRRLVADWFHDHLGVQVDEFALPG